MYYAEGEGLAWYESSALMGFLMRANGSIMNAGMIFLYPTVMKATPNIEATAIAFAKFGYVVRPYWRVKGN